MTDTLSCGRLSVNLYLLVISIESNTPFQGKLLLNNHFPVGVTYQASEEAIGLAYTELLITCSCSSHCLMLVLFIQLHVSEKLKATEICLCTRKIRSRPPLIYSNLVPPDSELLTHGHDVQGQLNEATSCASLEKYHCF